MKPLTLDGVKASKGTPLADRIMLHVRKAPNGCWEWTAALNEKGYGRIARAPRTLSLGYAHRVSYECFIGPIPKGMHIDHKCRVRHCVNPDHLEPVTPAENNRRVRESQRLAAKSSTA